MKLAKNGSDSRGASSIHRVGFPGLKDSPEAGFARAYACLILTPAAFFRGAFLGEVGSALWRHRLQEATDCKRSLQAGPGARRENSRTWHSGLLKADTAQVSVDLLHASLLGVFGGLRSAATCLRCLPGIMREELGDLVWQELSLCQPFL